MPRTVVTDMRLARSKATALRDALAAERIHRTLTQCQAAVAEIYGYADWAELKIVSELRRSYASDSLGSIDPVVVGCVLAGRFGISAAGAVRIALHVRFADIRTAPSGSSFEEIVGRADAAGWSYIRFETGGDHVDVRFGPAGGPRTRIPDPLARSLSKRLAELAADAGADGSGRCVVPGLPDAEIGYTCGTSSGVTVWSARILRRSPSYFGHVAMSDVGSPWSAAYSSTGIVLVAGGDAVGRTSVLRALEDDRVFAGDDVYWCSEPSTAERSWRLDAVSSVPNDFAKAMKGFMRSARTVVMVPDADDALVEAAVRMVETGCFVAIAMDGDGDDAVRRLERIAMAGNPDRPSGLLGTMVLRAADACAPIPKATWLPPGPRPFVGSQDRTPASPDATNGSEACGGGPGGQHASMQAT